MARMGSAFALPAVAWRYFLLVAVLMLGVLAYATDLPEESFQNTTVAGHIISANVTVHHYGPTNMWTVTIHDPVHDVPSLERYNNGAFIVVRAPWATASANVESLTCGFVDGEFDAVGLCWPSVGDPDDWSGQAGICMADSEEVAATSLVRHKAVEVEEEERQIEWRLVFQACLRVYATYAMVRIVYIVRDPTDPLCEEGRQSFLANLFAAVTLGLVCGMVQNLIIIQLVLVYYGWTWIALWPMWGVGCWLFAAVIFSSAWWPVANETLWDKYISSSIFVTWAKYFQLKVIVEGGLDESRKYLIAQLPHGVMPIGAMLAQSRARTDLPGVQPTGGVVAVMALRAWGLRYIFGCMGVRSAGPKNIRRFYDQGFKNGADILPVFVFGNSLLLGIYGQDVLRGISRKLRTALCPLYGDLMTIPRRQQLVVVVGRPIKVQFSADPSQAEVDALHQTLVEEVKRIWTEHRPSWETRELSIE